MILAFVGTYEDTNYLPYLKKYIKPGNSTFIYTKPFGTLTELVMYCKAKHITGVICTQVEILKKLVNRPERKAPSIDDYAGSYFLYQGVEIVFSHPLEHLFTVPYGSFLIHRYITKLTERETWFPETTFSWEIANESTLQSLYNSFTSAAAIAEDIETFKENLSIRCVGFAGIWFDGDSIRTHCIVIPCTSVYYLTWIKRFNDLPVPKIFQNGKYDIAYLSRYNAVPMCYYWDTAHMFHSWYSELPKDLGFLNAFFVRTARYWKDDSVTSDLEEYYLYNAKDLWATANVFLAWHLQAPKWAKENYLQEFPLVFPCHLAEMTGIARDRVVFDKVFTQKEVELEDEYTKLRKMVATPTFNTNSPVQVKSLLKVLGCSDLPSSDAKNLAKAKLRHPLNGRIIDKVISIRKTRKLISSYLKDGITLNERILYSLNPHGTDSARLASRDHHFWCGFQIQNIVRGESVKQFFISDEGFRFGEADFEQAESRDTAYLSGDRNLLEAVNSGRDFHATNASSFFGVAYESIINPDTKKILDKTLRDLAKRVNHGANYNMGPGVLIDTMGEDKVYQAAILLKLREKYPGKTWGLVEIATYLLEQFDKTYPDIRGKFYEKVVYEIATTGMLVSPAVPAVVQSSTLNGLEYYAAHLDYNKNKKWTRRFFADPAKSKHALNSAVAHKPQNLNALTLNRAWMLVFYNVWMRYPDHFKLCAQIHDSILFQYREGHEYLIGLVKQNMEIPVDVTDVRGITRRLVVPVAIKTGGKYWSELE
jgi:DNA polymerase I-like protein with 3'-5' exonuclease and polymerase domains